MPEFKFPEALILVNNRRHRTLPWLEIGRKYRWPGAVNPCPCLAWLALVLLFVVNCHALLRTGTVLCAENRVHSQLTELVQMRLECRIGTCLHPINALHTLRQALDCALSTPRTLVYISIFATQPYATPIQDPSVHVASFCFQ